MDATDLRMFEAVARLRGINRAAGELNTVQSNVTARIRRLEAELGVRLFDRHSRGVTPTAAGLRLLPFAQQIDSLLQQARHAVCDDGQPRGPLVIGALETTAALRLAPALAAFATAWPAVDMVLRTGTSAEMLEAVRTRRLEGAFVCGPVAHADLVAEPMFQEELVLLAAPMASTRNAPARGDLARLVARPDLKIVVLRAGCSYRQRLEEVLARRGAQGLRVLEFGTVDALLACAAAGIGVTLLPRAIVERAGTDLPLAIHPLPAAEAMVQTLFVQRRDGSRSAALTALLDQVRPSPRALAGAIAPGESYRATR